MVAAVSFAAMFVVVGLLFLIMKRVVTARLFASEMLNVELSADRRDVISGQGSAASAT
jgi:hypothetical protein